MPIDYADLELLHADDFVTRDAWHHEGVGELKDAPGGGMRMHCFGSKQGGPACMAFFRPDLPDQIAIEYDLTVRSHGGLLITYIAMRGLDGEDLIADTPSRLPPREGRMSDYFLADQGLQSYHISISRFNDAGQHTGTSNWRRNPGSLLAGHGTDPCCQIDTTYHIRITKDAGSCQLYVDGEFAHGFIDRDTAHHPIPDHGKLGFRVIGSDVMVDIANFRIHRIPPAPAIRKSHGLHRSE